MTRNNVYSSEFVQKLCQMTLLLLQQLLSDPIRTDKRGLLDVDPEAELKWPQAATEHTA